MGVATFDKKYKVVLNMMDMIDSVGKPKKKKSRKVAGKKLVEQTVVAPVATAAPPTPAGGRPPVDNTDKIPEIIKKAEPYYKKIDAAEIIAHGTFYPDGGKAKKAYDAAIDKLWAHYEKEAEKLGLFITDFVEPHMDYLRERNAKK